MVGENYTLVDKGWKVKKEQDNNIICSLIKTPTIYIEPVPKQKIDILMEEYPHQEWLAYLVGRVSKKENYFVEDLSIPPHSEAFGASAEAEPFHIPDNCIGIIHSHHTMGAFHSMTDKEYVDKNFPVSITVARKGQNLEFDAISSQLTPCNKRTNTQCPVKLVLPPPLFDKAKWLGTAKGNIDKGTVRRVIYNPNKYLYTPDNAGIGANFPRHNRLNRFGDKSKLPYSDFRDTVECIIDGIPQRLTLKELADHERSIYNDMEVD